MRPSKTLQATPETDRRKEFMSLPKAVQDAAKRSEELVKQLREGKPQDQDQGTTSQEQPNETPQDPDRDTLPTPEDKQQTQAQQKAKEDEETYKQRYLTLKGKFDAQVPRLQQDNQRLNAIVADLQTQVKQLQDTASANTQNNNGDDRSTIDADAFEEYGPEFSSLAKTVQILQQENTRLKEQVQDLSGDFQLQRQNDSEQARQNYMGQVVSHVSQLGQDFNVLNSDKKFLNWLRQFPDDEDESRHSKLLRAEEEMDLEATKKIFDEYLGKPQKSDKPKQQPNIQPDLRTTGTDSSPPKTNDKKIWTRAEISGFYAKKMKGFFRGKDEEAHAIEADIHAASGEGRIRG